MVASIVTGLAVVAVVFVSEPPLICKYEDAIMIFAIMWSPGTQPPGSAGCPLGAGAAHGPTLVHGPPVVVSRRSVVAHVVLGVVVPHAGVVVHHVAAAHVLGAGPDELGEVAHPQVGPACPLGGAHPGLQAGTPHLVIPLKTRLPPVRGHLHFQGVVVKGASLE